MGPVVAALLGKDQDRASLEELLHSFLLFFFGFLEDHDCLGVETETDHNGPEEVSIVNMRRYSLSRQVLIYNYLIELTLHS